MEKIVLPLYNMVVVDLQRQIDSGKFKTDDLIPSENELCKIYSTTRATVRNALNILANQGYITRQHGRGSVVSDRKKALGILSISGVTAGLTDGNLDTKIISKPKIVNWPTELCFERESTEIDLKAISFSRIRSIDKAPVLYEDTYISNTLAGFVNEDLANRSLFSLLAEKYNLRVLGGEQQFLAVVATEKLMKLLDVNVNQPILHVRRKLTTSDPQVYIYSNIYCNTEKYYLQDYF